MHVFEGWKSGPIESDIQNYSLHELLAAQSALLCCQIESGLDDIPRNRYFITSSFNQPDSPQTLHVLIDILIIPTQPFGQRPYARQTHLVQFL